MTEPTEVAEVRDRHWRFPARGGSADIGTLLDYIDKARADALREASKFMVHSPFCQWVNRGLACDCGYDAVLSKP